MPAYLIANVEVTDAVTYEEYRKQVPAITAAHGGRYLARGGAAEALEGEVAANRLVILEFPRHVAAEGLLHLGRTPAADQAAQQGSPVEPDGGRGRVAFTRRKPRQVTRSAAQSTPVARSRRGTRRRRRSPPAA